MKIEKKVIGCSILALIIGVSSVLPLTFLMSATAKADPTSEPWFSLSIPYAYWTAYDGPLNWSSDYFQQPEPNEGDPVEYSVSHQRMMVLNFTLGDISTTDPFDARVEYYQLRLSSDKESIMDMNWFVGTYKNGSFDFGDFLQEFHFRFGDWFDTAEFGNSTDGGSITLIPAGEGDDVTNPDWTPELWSDIFKFDNSTDGENGIPKPASGGNGVLCPDWTPEFSIQFPDGGGGTYATTDPVAGQNLTTPLVSALREAETLFITVHRIGWITFSANSTVVTLADNEIVAQIQLDKLGEATFLYNNLVPEEELANIDLMRPITFD
jgi:hypothetical protein